MESIRFIFISVLVCLSAWGCSTSRHSSRPGSPDLEITPPEVYQRWNPDNALHEAEADIRQNAIKIFYHGGIVAIPAGVDPENYELIEDLPFEDAGAGCVVIDADLRRLQSEFATIYNRRIVEWLEEGKAALCYLPWVASSAEGRFLRQTKEESI